MDPIDPRLLALAERLAVPIVLLAVLGTVGFFGAASPTPLEDVFWVFYGVLFLVSLLFIGWYVGRAPAESVVETTDPVAVLGARYAAGEIDEETFERMLDTLLDGRAAAPARERVAEPEA